MATLRKAGGLESRKFYKIHILFCRQDYQKCLELVEEFAAQPNNGFLYYPVFVKAMILRQQGRIEESLSVIEDSIRLDPQNSQNLKEVGRSLYLLGKHKIAMEIFDEALSKDANDWQVYHDKGLCYVYLKDFERAEAMFRKAIELEPHDKTYQQLGKVMTMQDKAQAALIVYNEALSHTPENADTLCQIGLIHLREGNNALAFEALESALSIHPQHPKAVLAMGSIYQDRLNLDSALLKYRIAAVVNPHSCQVWNNVGLCFFGKQRYIAAIACLKHALYLSPWEWIVCYNLGLVHINTAQYATAFHYFSAAINLKPSFPHTYMYLGVALARLGDAENAFHAYERAIQKDPRDPLFHLNYAITLYNNGKQEEAKQRFDTFQGLYDDMDEASKNADPELAEQATMMMSVLQIG